MKFEVYNDYNCEKEHFSTLEAAQKYAKELACDLFDNGGDTYLVTVSMVMPLEVYEYEPPEPSDGKVTCTCVTATTHKVRG